MKSTVHFTTARANPLSPTDKKDWGRFDRVSRGSDWTTLENNGDEYTVPNGKIAHISE